MFRKIALPEISRISLLIGVARLQYTRCNAAKNELLTKFVRGVLKLTVQKVPGSYL